MKKDVRYLRKPGKEPNLLYNLTLPLIKRRNKKNRSKSNLWIKLIMKLKHHLQIHKI